MPDHCARCDKFLPNHFKSHEQNFCKKCDNLYEKYREKGFSEDVTDYHYPADELSRNAWDDMEDNDYWLYVFSEHEELEDYEDDEGDDFPFGIYDEY